MTPGSLTLTRVAGLATLTVLATSVPPSARPSAPLEAPAPTVPADPATPTPAGAPAAPGLPTSSGAPGSPKAPRPAHPALRVSVDLGDVWHRAAECGFGEDVSRDGLPPCTALHASSPVELLVLRAWDAPLRPATDSPPDLGPFLTCRRSHAPPIV